MAPIFVGTCYDTCPPAGGFFGGKGSLRATIGRMSIVRRAVLGGASESLPVTTRLAEGEAAEYAGPRTDHVFESRAAWSGETDCTFMGNPTFDDQAGELIRYPLMREAPDSYMQRTESAEEELELTSKTEFITD